MALNEAAEKKKDMVCEILVDNDGFVLYNSCDEINI
jgi:hypothetical protein